MRRPRLYTALLLAILALHPRWAFSQNCTAPSFGVAPVNPPAANIFDAVAGDFQGDGTLDLAMTNGNQVSVLVGNGTGGFPFVPTNTVVGNALQVLVAGDLNRDGRLDLLVVNRVNATSFDVWRLLGSGGGGFNLPVVVANRPTQILHLLLADFTNDGALDLVMVDDIGDVRLLRGDGAGGFLAPTFLLGGGILPGQPVAGDFDRDGDLDLIVPDQSSTSLLYFQGDRQWLPAAPPIPSAVAGVSVLGAATLAGDFDRDGRPDLVVATLVFPQVYFIRGNGNGTFVAPVNYPIGAVAGRLAVLDANRDGWPDLAVAQPSGVSFLLNNGAGGFSAALPVALAGSPRALAAGDFNNDGRADLFAALGGAPATLPLLLNSLFTACPNASFGPATRVFPTSAGSAGVTRADLNADGRLDLVVTNTDGTLSVFLWDGAANPAGFRLTASPTVGGVPRYSVAGDFDGDGKLDLAVSNPGGNYVSILKGNGDGTFAAPVNFAVAGGPTGLATGDLDRDGDLDLVSNLPGGGVAVLLGTGSGTFTGPTLVATPGTSTTWVALADFDGDFKLDLAVTDSVLGACSVWPGLGTGTFGPATDHPVGAGPNFVIVADLNTDGKPDLVTSNLTANSASALVNQGAFVFARTDSFLGVAGPQSLDTGHFNTDGNLDLLVGASGSNLVTILGGNGAGGFPVPLFLGNSSGTPKMTIAGDFTGDGLEDAVVAHSTGGINVMTGNGTGGLLGEGTFSRGGQTGPTSIAVGDFDRNGIQDVALTYEGSDSVSVFLGNGSGGFTFQATLTPGTVDPQQVVTSDFDRDGDLDLAVVCLGPAAGNGKVHFFMGAGNGNFTVGPSLDTGKAPYSLFAGDLDRDGDPDVAVANSGDNDVSIFLNNGTGLVYNLVGTRPATQLVPRFITAGQLNAGGIPDLVVANYGSNSVSVFFGTTTAGIYSAAVSVGVGGGPRSIALGDFDLDTGIDGDTDVVTANETSNNLSVLRNDGAGNLTLSSNVPTAGSPMSVATADFNGDGDLDLAVATLLPRGVSIHLGAAGLGFTSLGHWGVRSSGAAGGPNWVAVGDLNRDDRPEVLATDVATSVTSVFLNTNCRSRRMDVTTQPSTCNPLAPAFLATQPRLRLTDDGGNVNNCDQGSVTAALASSPGGAVLGGTLSVPVNLVGGSADYTNLTVNTAGPGYKLGFTHSPVAPAPAALPARSRRFTAAISLTLNEPPAVCLGSPATFSVSPPAFERYRWQLDTSTPVPGGPIFTVPPQTPVLHTLAVQASIDACIVSDNASFTPEGPLTGVTLSVGPGSTAVCTGCTGATVTAVDVGGGPLAHQWGYRTTPGLGLPTPIPGQTLASYVIHGADFLPGPGVYYLVATTTPACGPVTESNELQVVVFTTAPGPGLPVFTATSTKKTNTLEWLYPSGFGEVLIKFNASTTGSSNCLPPADPGAGTTLGLEAGPLGSRDSRGHGSLEDDTDYCYSAFVHVGGGTFAMPGKEVRGRPFDNAVDRVKWAFSTGVASLAPPGIGVGVVHVVANDSSVHAVVKGAGGGTWAAPPWSPPLLMTGPYQGRPSGVPVAAGSANPAIIVSSQDGHVYAFDADSGASGWSPSSPFLGSAAGDIVQAPPSGVFTAFGGTRDLIFVGSRNSFSGAPNVLYALRLDTGGFAAPGWTQSAGGPDGRIGVVNGQAAVDYNSSPPRVYFASRAFGSAPADRTLWCLNLETGAIIWAEPHGDIDGSVTLRGDRLYVGAFNGVSHEVRAIDTGTGLAKWVLPTGDGPVKGFVLADRVSSDLYFSTTGRVWGITDTGGTTFTPKWNAPLGFVAFPNPSTPLYAPQDTFVFVGGGGRLFRLGALDGSLNILDSFRLGDGNAQVGSPTLDILHNFVYVGTDAGIVYAIQLP